MWLTFTTNLPSSADRKVWHRKYEKTKRKKIVKMFENWMSCSPGDTRKMSCSDDTVCAFATISSSIVILNFTCNYFRKVEVSWISNPATTTTVQWHNQKWWKMTNTLKPDPLNLTGLVHFALDEKVYIERTDSDVHRSQNSVKK